MARFEVRKSARALVVDDNDSALLITARWLLEAGYVVSTASTFEEGLKTVQTHCPDLLILDVRLGEFNGLHLAIAAHQLRPEARIVMISGWDDPVLRTDARVFAASYLCKPFSGSQLLEEIRREVPKVRHVYKQPALPGARALAM